MEVVLNTRVFHYLQVFSHRTRRAKTGHRLAYKAKPRSWGGGGGVTIYIYISIYAYIYIYINTRNSFHPKNSGTQNPLNDELKKTQSPGFKPLTPEPGFRV